MKKLFMVLSILFVLQLFQPLGVYAQGNGIYTPYYYLYTNSVAQAVAIGDLDGDGDNDVALVTGSNGHANDNSLFVFLQNASGELANPVLYDAGNGASVDIGDLDGDGLNDVVVTTSTGIGVFIQEDDHTLADMVTHAGAGAGDKVRVADLGGDTQVDVVAITAATGDVDVYIQSSGALGTPDNYSYTNSGNVDLTVGDINSDTNTDIVITSTDGASTHRVSILLQGAFGTEVTYTPPNAPGGCAIGDVNDNAVNDLAVVGSTQASIFLQNGSNTLTTPTADYTISVGPLVPVEIYDGNQGGLNDVISASNTALTILYQQGGGTLGEEESYPLPTASTMNPHGMAMGDINNSGVADVVIANPEYGLVVLYDWDDSDAIVVNTPYRGQSVNTASTFTILWGSNGDTADVSIHYSIDGGNWEPITLVTTNDGSHNWTVPLITTTDCRIMVSDVEGDPTGISETFAIANDNVDRLQLIAPNGDEYWLRDSVETITWLSTGSMTTVKLDYSTNNGTSWTSIATAAANSGSYSWTLPSTTSSTCLVRVSSSDDSTTDSSDSTFNIVDAITDTLTLTYPNGGEVFPGGSTQSVSWSSTGTDITTVDLAYSTNSGTSWITFVSGTANDGSYSWSVPNTTSATCLVRVSGLDGATTVSDTGNAVFSIVSAGNDRLTITAPNGGQDYLPGFKYYITWTSSGSVSAVDLDYSIDNGSSWLTIINGTANDLQYNWTVPDTPSDECLVRITSTTNSLVTDTSNAVFSIAEILPTIQVSSPAGDESWQVNSTHEVTWTAPEEVGNVKLEYTVDSKVNWWTITGSTPNDGSYAWVIPNKPSTTCYVRISEAADGTPSGVSPRAFRIVGENEEPEITLDRNKLYFSSVKLSTVQTPGQVILIYNTGAVPLYWSLTNDAAWLRLSGTSGVDSGVIEVTVDPFSLAVGTYTGTITVSDTNASNSPQTVTVTHTVLPNGADSAPFGSMGSPVDGSNLRSSIPVSGWALDDIGINSVKIYRDAVSGEGGGQVYIGDAGLVAGARPDIEQSYPTYPMADKAGWGYMLLTNFLPDGGNGTYKLHAYAADEAGNSTLLGSKTIHCDNAYAVKPFGAIDTPTQGGDATGTEFRNHGWALTPMPNSIAQGTTAVKLYINGILEGNANYGHAREDIPALFPGYANSERPHAFFDIDTTQYANGVHSIYWIVTDNAGNTDGIGSRYFTIRNSGFNRTARRQSGRAASSLAPLKGAAVHKGPLSFHSFPGKYSKAQEIKMNTNGKTRVSFKANTIMELSPATKGERLVRGFMVVGKQLRPLPIGSGLDAETGTFRWHAGPGFLGNYKILFIGKNAKGKTFKRPVTVKVSAE
ncbi:MAG: hypothetical protein GY765_28725 [bacterium]|nr:hypothetical protein [bacterium]